MIDGFIKDTGEEPKIILACNPIFGYLSLFLNNGKGK